MFIRGIKNPSQYEYKNFTITYYKNTVTNKVLDWIYKYPLTYYISNPPNFLSIDSVTVSDNDVLYPSVYKFVFKGPQGTFISRANKQYSYVIVIPTFYRSTLDANTQPICKFDQLASNSPCELLSG